MRKIQWDDASSDKKNQQWLLIRRRRNIHRIDSSVLTGFLNIIFIDVVSLLIIWFMDQIFQMSTSKSDQSFENISNVIVFKDGKFFECKEHDDDCATHFPLKKYLCIHISFISWNKQFLLRKHKVFNWHQLFSHFIYLASAYYEYVDVFSTQTATSI